MMKKGRKRKRKRKRERERDGQFLLCRFEHEKPSLIACEIDQQMREVRRRNHSTKFFSVPIINRYQTYFLNLLTFQVPMKMILGGTILIFYYTKEIFTFVKKLSSYKHKAF